MCVFIWVSKCMYAYIICVYSVYACMCVCLSVRCVYTRVCVCVGVYVYICMYVCPHLDVTLDGVGLQSL